MKIGGPLSWREEKMTRQWSSLWLHREYQKLPRSTLQGERNLNLEKGGHSALIQIARWKKMMTKKSLLILSFDDSYEIIQESKHGDGNLVLRREANWPNITGQLPNKICWIISQNRTEQRRRTLCIYWWSEVPDTAAGITWLKGHFIGLRDTSFWVKLK